MIHKYFSFTKLVVLLSSHDLRAALQHRSCFFNSENKKGWANYFCNIMVCSRVDVHIITRLI